MTIRRVVLSNPPNLNLAFRQPTECWLCLLERMIPVMKSSLVSAPDVAFGDPAEPDRAVAVVHVFGQGRSRERLPLLAPDGVRARPRRARLHRGDGRRARGAHQPRLLRPVERRPGRGLSPDRRGHRRVRLGAGHPDRPCRPQGLGAPALARQWAARCERCRRSGTPPWQTVGPTGEPVNAARRRRPP